MTYPAALRELISGRVLKRELSITAAAKLYGVGRSTIGTWLPKAQVADNGTPTSPKSEKPQMPVPYLPPKWTYLKIHEAVVLMDALPADQFGEYCRKRGIHASLVKEWKDWFAENPEVLVAPEISSMRHEMHKQRADLTKANRTIEKQTRKLSRNEKALAEYAALVVLSKKLEAVWDKDEAE